MENSKTKKIVLLAMLSAISYLVVFLMRIPLIPSLDFLHYEAKDVIITLAGFILGPIASLEIAVVVSLIEMITISTTGPIGFIMNALGTCAFALPAAIIYKKDRTLRGAAIGLTVGTILMTATMLMWNYFITPLYMGWPREAVAELLIPGFLPFNLIKGAINASLTFILYKPLVEVLRKAKLLPQSNNEKAKKKSAVIFNICAAAILAISIVIIFVLKIIK